MREIAIELKKDNLDINYFASTVGIKKVLDRMVLPEVKLESLLEDTKIRCLVNEDMKKNLYLK